MCAEDAEAGDLLAIDELSVEIGAKLNIPGSGLLRAEFTRQQVYVSCSFGRTRRTSVNY